MMPVDYEAKMNMFVGSLGPSESGEMFQPLPSAKVSMRTDLMKDNSYSIDNHFMYRGMIMKDKNRRTLIYTAYSYINLLEDSGGIIGAITGIFAPIGVMLSGLSFDLGVMSLLFMAKSKNKPKKKKKKRGERKKNQSEEEKYTEVQLSNW